MRGRTATTLDAPPPIPEEAAAFVARVTREMASGRQLAEEVRRESLGHFEDALEGIEGLEERAAAVQALLRDFGDENLLAALIRRGKRRCEKGTPASLLGMAMAGGVFCLAIALGANPEVFTYVSVLAWSVGLVLGPSLAAHGARAVCHALWVARALFFEVDPDSVSDFDVTVLRAMVQRGYIAAAGGLLLGLIVTLRYGYTPSIMVMTLLVPLWAGLISEGLLRPSARRVEILYGLSELAVPACGTAAKGESV